MPSKAKTVYVCSSCGMEFARWSGKCPSCGEWNTLEESIAQPQAQSRKAASAPSIGLLRERPVTLDSVDENDEVRYTTGWSELDRVFGGGIVKGSLVLIGGEPGVGKSTLLMQICQTLCSEGKVLYVSGEESARQLKLRAKRLNVSSENLLLLTETDVDTILAAVDQIKPNLVIIDSIQTMHLAEVSSSTGSVTQVRESASRFQYSAKSGDISYLLIGHVNKDGAIAGPKVLEHLVDAVLLFEGDRTLTFRILRAVKNRFGSTNEIGVFEMQASGLEQVTNPSAMLLDGRPVGVPGTCISCVMEGTRPILTEIQALVTKSSFSVPRRMATGFDYNRLMMLIAILEKRAGYFCGSLDIYANVIGGLRLDETAADLPVLLALMSSIRDIPIHEHTLAIGEVGLIGEVRTVSHIEQRVAEAARLGFTRCILPATALKGKHLSADGIELIPVHNIGEAVQYITAPADGANG